MVQAYHHGALRQALLDAAEAILDRESIDALTLRAIAREAGVSHAAPAHHFRDLSGLLTELAASGFDRLADALREGVAHAEPASRLKAMGLAYVAFARRHPGIFILMFRSERLDWSSTVLCSAGERAFELLTDHDQKPCSVPADLSLRTLMLASTRWSLIHGLATLIVDGRLDAFAEKVPDADMDQIIVHVLDQGL